MDMNVKNGENKMFETKNVWWIECCTGCSCCSDQNYDMGFWNNPEEPQKMIDRWLKGDGNPLASQYAKYGRYYLHSSTAEILPDGRIIVDDHVFNADTLEWQEVIHW